MSDRQERLARQVETMIESYTPWRASGSRVQVSCHNHICTLRGIARSRTLKSLAAALARRVEGVREVRNELVCDTDLQVEVSRRLAADERTRAVAPSVTVRVLLGAVDLHGLVADEAARRAVAKVAGEVPGVVQVVNHLRDGTVPPPPLAEPQAAALSSSAGSGG